MKLVDSVDEQALLEEMLDASKPPVPIACQHLHYLQYTPFRYPARHATRFRAKGDRRGVYYASESVKTCATEVAFYRVLFYLESPETTPSPRPFEMTAFRTTVGGRSVDVSLLGDPAPHADPIDYAAPHILAKAVRSAEGQIIRFPSVRDKGGTNLAVLNCAAFRSGIEKTQGWWFRFGDRGLFASERFGEGRLEFPFEMFGDDPRVILT
jgi:hypothetical protein